MDNDNEENFIRKHNEKAVREYIETILNDQERAINYCKENNLQLALKVSEHALNLAEHLYKAGYRQIYEVMNEIKEGIREIKKKDKNKIYIRKNAYGKEKSFLVDWDELTAEFEDQPTEEIDDQNYIALENYLDEYIQFVRLEKDYWVIDIPMEYISLQEEDLSTFQVKMIVFNFMKGNFPLVELSKIKDLDWQRHKFRNIINSIPSELTCQYCGDNIIIGQDKCNFCGMQTDCLLKFDIKDY